MKTWDIVNVVLILVRCLVLHSDFVEVMDSWRSAASCGKGLQLAVRDSIASAVT